MPCEDERKFLHDISNPLSIVHGNLKIALRKMDPLKEADPQCLEVIERLGKAIEACDRIVKQVGERRQFLLDGQNQAAG